MTQTKQKATIVAKTWNHEFKIGTKGTVVPAVTPGVYAFTSLKGETDWVKPTEIKLED